MCRLRAPSKRTKTAASRRSRAQLKPEPAEIDIKTRRNELRVDGGLRNLSGRYLDNVKLTFAVSDYRHDEIETEDSIESLGTRFDNDTNSLRVEVEQKRAGRLTGRLGIDWLGRDYLATGAEALAPPTTQHGVFSVRRTRRWRSSGSVSSSAAESNRRITTWTRAPLTRNDRRCGTATSPARLARSVFMPISRPAVAFVANVTAASRAPALEELYNFGPHVGNLAFEIGNPDLELEQTVGLDFSLRGRAEGASGRTEFLTYGISNFVFLDFTGEEVEGLREANYLQADSRFVGAEGKS